MSIAFGTSGLRGPAEGFTSVQVGAYVTAFLERVGDGPDTIYVAADLRDSSPAIARMCLGAIADNGWAAVYAGNVPTPALAAYAMAQNCPALMITGSHIPETYNGIKFYRRDGELLKSDEAPIRERVTQLLEVGIQGAAIAQLSNVDAAVGRSYVERFVSAFGGEALAGLRLGVDMHSAVGRDLLVEILIELGASCFPFRRMDQFIAVDTEALAPEDLERAKEQIAAHDLDAVVSTDGDGDRPLLIDAEGRQINGDVLGALSAHALNIDCVVTPLSSTSAIELSGWFEKTIRTRIGSPYVVAAMGAAAAKTIAGFEANGGFLLGTDVELERGALRALPTRDAVLPLVVVLAAAKAHTGGLTALVNSLPQRVMQADRVRDVPAQAGAVFLKEIAEQQEARQALHPLLAEPENIDLTDGVRMQLQGNISVHLRQSGNAPEMRAYVETGSATETAHLLGELMVRLERVLHG
jgi:phosphomannomutase